MVRERSREEIETETLELRERVEWLEHQIALMLQAAAYAPERRQARPAVAGVGFVDAALLADPHRAPWDTFAPGD